MVGAGRGRSATSRSLGAFLWPPGHAGLRLRTRRLHIEIATTERAIRSAQSDWRLYQLTDLHIDERDHAGPELDAMIQKIQGDDNALWLGGGDYGGLIVGGDPRVGDGYLEGVPGDRVPDHVKEVVVEKLRPIRDKCIGFGAGNHEWSLMQRYHRGVAAEIAADLGLQHLYLAQRGWAHVTFRNVSAAITLKVFWYHGWSSGRGKSRKMLQAERDIAARPGAHVQMLGHDHQPWIDASFYVEETYHSSKGAPWRIRQTPRVVMNGGSFTYGQLPPDKKKSARKPSEMRNELWKEKSNYRPQPPNQHPVCHVHVDFGMAAKAKHATGGGNKGRPMGFDFRTEMVSPRFHPE